tara:strand:+ start:522 stop:1007 length:486 start_codon:yes stop_codon:yes gene_type:complete
MIKKRGIKGQSQIVSSVLLILIAIAAAGLIIGFVIPFVKNKLSGGDCLEIINKVKISPRYTCYDDPNSVLVQIHIDDIRDVIDGFSVELGGPSSKNYNILEDDHTGVSMYEGGSFELPNNTEERTYNMSVTVKPEYIKVYPILKGGKSCGEADSETDIKDC